MCKWPRLSRRAALVLLQLLSLSAHATNTTDCERLSERYRREDTRARVVTMEGREWSVALVWGAAPARAAAALLRALLVAALRYQRDNVTLQRDDHRIVNLNISTYNLMADYKEFRIVVSAAWAGERGVRCVTSNLDECGVAGPRLRDFGAAAVPARVRLHAHLAPNVGANRGWCARAVAHWLFYTNESSLTACHFVQNSGRHNTSVLVYYPDEVDANLKNFLEELLERAAAASLPLDVQPLKRLYLFRELRSNSTSFLFLDYDIWRDDPNVLPVTSPPCAAVTFDCREELDPSEALRAVDANMFTRYAPDIFDAFHKFNTSLQSLREILEDEASGTDVQEAACKWALKEKVSFAKLLDSTKPEVVVYQEIVFVCKNDMKAYIDLVKITHQSVFEHFKNYKIDIRVDDINCDDPKAAISSAESYMKLIMGQLVIGFVAGSEGENADLAAFAARFRLPLILYDSPAETTDAGDKRIAPMWTSVGRLRPLALVVRHLAIAQHWTRLAVLSDATPFARDFFNALNDGTDDIALHDYSIQLDPSLNVVLEKLRDVNARIVFVNSRADIAAKILSAAVENNMMNDDYAWIVRDWPPRNNTLGVQVVSISYWSLSDDDVPSHEGLPKLRARMNQLWPAREWPARAVALVDAMLTLAYGFQEVKRRQSSITEYDIHTDQTIIDYKTVMADGFKSAGVLRNLSYNVSSQARAPPMVYVDKWRGAERTSLGRCQVDDVHVKCDLKRVYPDGAPADGASRCVARTGDAFWPRCYDAAWIAALVVAALVPPGSYLARRVVLRHLRRRDRHLLLQLLARRERAAEALAAHLVPRSALEPREELGAGRFGRVHLALLRTGGRTRVVAAKSLREGAAPTEESEFLREACTLAALEHEHIVRLVGVCADDGPPLVLMEHAFFGDLLRYLRARRHLAEAALDGAEEAAHVAPEALTRLAREAASALGYLALRGLVHRDVRAANCLVDARRSLKLADFGMARETAAAGADGAAEYACRRRALFPVLWMAPESLARGVFSAASDVWALGVLLLELVTLGERPYGDMSPLRVLQYVAAGGRPPLPRDTTPQTRGVVLACWQRAAEQRPTAPELVSYLAGRPRALRAALQAPRLELTDVDSGYGEPASPDLLHSDRCLDGLDCAASVTYHGTNNSG